MKQPWEWDEGDILTMIENKEPESLSLEYKACAALTKKTVSGQKDTQIEVSKDVSAFANSAGGTIIYGVKEKDNQPLKIDTGYEPQDINKEWLEHVLSAKIQRKIDGMIIKEIPLKNSSPGKNILLVYVPQSVRAPHMAADKRFYKRYNFESVPMEEYEIRDIANRTSSPDLSIDYGFANKEITPSFETTEEYSQPIRFNPKITNHSTAPAEYIHIRLCIDARLKLIETAHFRLAGTGERLGIPIKIYTLNWGIQAHMPVWEGIAFQTSDMSMSLTVPKTEGNYVLGWEVHSPKMQAKIGLQSLKHKGTKLEITENIEVFMPSR